MRTFEINARLRQLSIVDSRHPLGDTSWFRCFCQCSKLQQSNLATLSISGNFLGNTVLHLKSILPPTLTTLNLAQNNLGDATIAALFERTFLRILILDVNNLSLNGIVHALFPPTLTHLSIESNCLNVDSTPQLTPHGLVQEWQLPTSLQHLYISHNNLKWSYITCIPLPPHLLRLDCSAEYTTREDCLQCVSQLRAPPFLNLVHVTQGREVVAFSGNCSHNFSKTSYFPVYLLYARTRLITVCYGAQYGDRTRILDSWALFLRTHRGSTHIRRLILTYWNMFSRRPIVPS